MSAAARLSSPLARGACPSVAAPMQTGDGLLVRLRPRAAGLTPDAWIEIARLARRNGNGLIEVTARGNLQIRGLRAETAPMLAEGLDAAGIALCTGVAIEVPPLAGLDPSEVADATALAEALETAMAGYRPSLALAPKLAIVVDGGGALSLADMVADLRLDAVRMDNAVLWRVSIAGDAFSARPVGLYDASAAVDTVMRLLEQLAALGPAARGRDLDAAALAAQPDFPVWTPALPCAPVGAIALGDAVVLGLGLPYGQIDADSLAALASDLKALGVSDIRLAPHRALLVCGLDAAGIAIARRQAAVHGFRVDPADARNVVSVCAGTAGCASARLDTHAVAAALLTAVPALFDGATAVHVSGCPKGCAHPAKAPLTLVGTPDGAGLVLDGRAGDTPLALTAPADLDAAFARLETWLRRERRPGEPLSSLRDRLGAASFETAFQGRS